MKNPRTSTREKKTSSKEEDPWMTAMEVLAGVHYFTIYFWAFGRNNKRSFDSYVQPHFKTHFCLKQKDFPKNEIR